MQEKYNVTGMTCAACQARVQKSVSNLTCVQECNVNLLKNSIDDVTAMIAGQIGQLLPMDEETAGQFQQLAKKMIELAGKETKIDGGNHDVTTKRSSM